jgi:hypothetical protein
MIDPAALDLLREAVANSSAAAVARRLRDVSGDKYPSDALISRVLSGSYNHDTARLEALVQGCYGGAVVECPILGQIGRDACDRNQRAPFSPSNPMRVQLYRACRGGCPNAAEPAG